jgi:hypothetical protein
VRGARHSRLAVGVAERGGLRLTLRGSASFRGKCASQGPLVEPKWPVPASIQDFVTPFGLGRSLGFGSQATGQDIAGGCPTGCAHRLGDARGICKSRPARRIAQVPRVVPEAGPTARLANSGSTVRWPGTSMCRPKACFDLRPVNGSTTPFAGSCYRRYTSAELVCGPQAKRLLPATRVPPGRADRSKGMPGASPSDPGSGRCAKAVLYPAPTPAMRHAPPEDSLGRG